MSDRHHACSSRLQRRLASRHSLAGLFAALTAAMLLSLVLVQPALAQQAPGGGPQSANIFDQPVGVAGHPGRAPGQAAAQ